MRSGAGEADIDVKVDTERRDGSDVSRRRAALLRHVRLLAVDCGRLDADHCSQLLYARIATSSLFGNVRSDVVQPRLGGVLERLFLIKGLLQGLDFSIETIPLILQKPFVLLHLCDLLL